MNDHPTPLGWPVQPDIVRPGTAENEIQSSPVRTLLMTILSANWWSPFRLRMLPGHSRRHSLSTQTFLQREIES
jgi:hypothetical protein